MIREIHLKNFRNYKEEKVSFTSGINLFCGKNGQGKTNLLEAVYFLSMLTSFRKAEPAQMIRRGEELLSVKGLFFEDDATILFVEKTHNGWREISADGGLYRKKSDYIGKVRIVVFSPEEMELIQGSPEGRRRYLDRTCFNLSNRHLKKLKTYRKILRQKNNLLKKGGGEQEIDAWSERLAHSGADVIKGRAEVIGMLNSELCKRRPFLGADRLSLRYSGNRYAGKDCESAGRLLDIMVNVRGEERQRRMALVGPHRDDLEISINGIPAKAFSSRGEMRSILLALKTAETEIYRSNGEQEPIILLDDVASELDVERRGALMDYLREAGGQVLMTTTEADNIPLLDSEKGGVFTVARGGILH